MRRVYSLYSTSVGKKYTMAVSGAIFVLFVIVHMFGNLKVYLGPEAFNHYAEGLREFGEPFLGYEWFLWVFRAGLVAFLLIHTVAAWQTSRQSWAARGQKYKKQEKLVFHYASRTMRWGGVALLLFVVYHILHLTTGTLHPDFVPGDAYHNFVTGFRSVPVVAAYTLAMIALGLHLYHGIWSAFQTMGLDGPRTKRWRMPMALAVSLIVVLVNLSFPVAVYTGILQ
ncbi:MAG: succinate dehydrogenase cytochrome b subunit [Gemmatimonadetes bacterium]|nr:succinate dehydrogenase cytochrome b subunit [Gemmatimonadota bacterium]NNK48108.1 succinate dehydrogenase cytochrome b subunit [Gemmatimonadota bacterium]